jgi:hypothetical protein
MNMSGTAAQEQEPESSSDEVEIDDSADAEAITTALIAAEQGILQRAFESRKIGAFKAWTRSHRAAWSKKLIAEFGCSAASADGYCADSYNLLNRGVDVKAMIDEWYHLRGKELAAALAAHEVDA